MPKTQKYSVFIIAITPFHIFFNKYYHNFHNTIDNHKITTKTQNTATRCPKNINEFSRSFQIIVLKTRSFNLKTPRALVDVFGSTGSLLAQ